MIFSANSTPIYTLRTLEGVLLVFVKGVFVFLEANTFVDICGFTLFLKGNLIDNLNAMLILN